MECGDASPGEKRGHVRHSKYFEDHMNLKSRLKKISRRRFLLTMLVATPVAIVADARLVEPTWLNPPPVADQRQTRHRFVHFDCITRATAMSRNQSSNHQCPVSDFVCFTGHIIEEAKFLPEALELLSGTVAGIMPGNHDYCPTRHRRHRESDSRRPAAPGCWTSPRAGQWPD
jgi:hypothetical protein